MLELLFLQLLALPLALAVNPAPPYTSDTKVDPNFKCFGDIPDVLAGQPFRKSDYSDLTALCATASDGHPTLGCGGCSSTSPGTCLRANASTQLFDWQYWPEEGNVTIPINLSWLCLSQCTCNGQAPNYNATAELSPQSVQLTELVVPPFNSDGIADLYCIGPVPDTDPANVEFQAANYADFTAVCGISGSNPSVGCDCSGPGGNLTCDGSKASSGMYNRFQRPPGNAVQPFSLPFLCKQLCTCPNQTLSAGMEDWLTVWSDGSKNATLLNGTSVVELIPASDFRDLSSITAQLATDYRAGPNATNVDYIWADGPNSSYSNSTSSSAGPDAQDPSALCANITDLTAYSNCMELYYPSQDPCNGIADTTSCAAAHYNSTCTRPPTNSSTDPLLAPYLACIQATFGPSPCAAAQDYWSCTTSPDANNLPTPANPCDNATDYATCTDFHYNTTVYLPYRPPTVNATDFYFLDTSAYYTAENGTSLSWDYTRNIYFPASWNGSYMGAINETLLPNGTINAASNSTLNYVPSPCNCSYVSYACFIATSGRVWEPPDRQFKNQSFCDDAVNGSADGVTGVAGGNASNSEAYGYGTVNGSANGTVSDQGLRARRAKRSKNLWEVDGEVRRETPLGRERRR